MKKIREIKRTMSDRRRGLILEVSQCHPNVLPLMHHLHKHYVKADLILEYLLFNKITGNKLIDVLRTFYGNSPLKFFADMLRRAEKERWQKPVLLNKDFIGVF